eukprot:s3966_g2.t4
MGVRVFDLDYQFGFLHRVRPTLKRHEFRLDFTPAELNGALPALDEPILDAHSVYKSAQMSPSFEGVLKSVLAGIPKQYATNRAEATEAGALEVRNFLYITMVFGSQYVPYIPRFVSRAEAFGLSNLVLFCLDDAALDACRALGQTERCVSGTPSILNKFTLPLMYLWLKIDVFWLDFDIFLLQDPTPFVLGEAQRSGTCDLFVTCFHFWFFGRVTCCLYREDTYHQLVISAVLMELQMAHVLSYLSLKNIFAAKCCSRLINQLVCSRRSTFCSKVLFQECMVPYLVRMEADPGFLSSILASNLVQWAHLGQTPALPCLSGNASGRSGGGLAVQNTEVTQRFLQLDSALARMMACANLKQTRFASEAENKRLEMLVASLPLAKWDNVRYYDALITIHDAEHMPRDKAWICQKYGATVLIHTPGGKLELNFVASHELTEVVEERTVYCSVSFPGQHTCSTLLRTRAERWIEEENFTSFAPSVDIEEWHKLHRCFFGEEHSSTTTTVALVFRLLSAPVTAWQLDNWRRKCGRSEGLGRLNFEDRPTMLWLRDEFALVADRLVNWAPTLQRLGPAPWMGRLLWRRWDASLPLPEDISRKFGESSGERQVAHGCLETMKLCCVRAALMLWTCAHWFTRWRAWKTWTAWHSDLSSTIKDCIGISDCQKFTFFKTRKMAIKSGSKVQPKHAKAKWRDSVLFRRFPTL